MSRGVMRSRPGQAIGGGLAVKALAIVAGTSGSVPAWLALLDNLASLVLIVALGYLATQGMAFLSRRLLWRVRRKLVISYVFIGVVPAILIVAFFLLGGLLLFSNFSSYLVQSSLRTLAERGQFVAEMTAVEIQRLGRRETTTVLARRHADAALEFPDLSMAVVRLSAACASPRPPLAAGSRPTAVAGPWAHASAPTDIPSWIACEGFRGLLAVPIGVALANGPEPPRPAVAALGGFGAPVRVVVRAVSLSESEGDPYAVVVDIPLGAELVDRLREETGVSLTDVRSLEAGLRPAEPTAVGAAPAVGDVAPPATGTAGLPLTSVAFLDYVDWRTGARSSLRAGIRMNVRDTYQRIAAAEGEVGRYSFGQGLLLVLLVIGVLFLFIEAMALVVGWALARSITGSVHELFVGTERVRAGDFSHKIDIRAKDQLGELADSFNSMTSSIESLLQEQAEKRRLEEELRIAHEIQMSLLPQGPLGLPGLDVTALSVPAREVGGDYYDFFPLDEARLGVLVADVSGKGTSAALYMAELKGLMLSLSRTHTSPRAILIEANRIIAHHLDSRSFITMTYAVIDLRARTCVYARAGHTPMVYVPAGGLAPGKAQVLAPDGMVVGLKLDDGQMFERLLCEETLAIAAGDLFVLFTDGITEAMNAQDDCFGEERLAAFLEAHVALPSLELRERLLREVEAFVAPAPQHDDLTMVMLRVGETPGGGVRTPAVTGVVHV